MAHRLNRMFVVANSAFGRHHPKWQPTDIVLGQFSLDEDRVSDQEDFSIDGSECLNGSLYRFDGGIVASHRVHGDAHRAAAFRSIE